MMKTYNELKDMLSTARDKDKGKPIARNTRIFERGNDIAIRFHSTDIIIVSPENIYTLNTGGWKTTTTKERMNEFTPAHIFQKNFVFMLNGSIPSVFYDGIQVNSEGKIVSEVVKPEKIVKENNAMKTRIKFYVKGFNLLIESGKLELPSTGDCWYCSILSDNSQDVSHLISHFEESYYVPSLLGLALKDAGLNVGVWFQMIKGGKDSKTVSRVLTKYLVKKLITNK